MSGRYPYPNTAEDFEAHLAVDCQWTAAEIRAAMAGWEWAFDTGRDQPDLDQDVPSDIAAGLGVPKKYREKLADCVYHGITHARAAQFPGGAKAFAEHRAKEREKLIAEIRAEIRAQRGGS